MQHLKLMLSLSLVMSPAVLADVQEQNIAQCDEQSVAIGVYNGEYGFFTYTASGISMNGSCLDIDAAAHRICAMNHSDDLCVDSIPYNEAELMKTFCYSEATASREGCDLALKYSEQYRARLKAQNESE